MKSVCVVGLGYIGLPTAVLAAQSGYQVFGFDVDYKKVEKINSGDAPFIEPEISERLVKVLDKNFFASTVMQQADCFLVAVPTPFKTDSEIKKADLSYVFDAAKSIAKVLRPGNLVILESTVSVGTTYEMAKFLEQEAGLKLGIDLFVAHCPERVLPGKIFEELAKNDRVIGGVSEESAYLAKTFYSKFVKAEFYLTDDKTAEMVKLIENSSRDVQIAFANQVAEMCKQANINPFEVIECANKHPRVNILNPGCGVGGHCIAVDPWFLVESFPQGSELLKIARDVNDSKPLQVVTDVLKKVDELKTFQKDVVRDTQPAAVVPSSLRAGRSSIGVGESAASADGHHERVVPCTVRPEEPRSDVSKGLSKPKLLILGLTFKADVDDMRESPALKVALELNKHQEDLQVSVCEPNVAVDKLQKLGFEKINSLINGVVWADMILILVKHKEFYLIRDLNLENKFILDICGLLYKCNVIKYSEKFNAGFNIFKSQSNNFGIIKNL